MLVRNGMSVAAGSALCLLVACGGGGSESQSLDAAGMQASSTVTEVSLEDMKTVLGRKKKVVKRPVVTAPVAALPVTTVVAAPGPERSVVNAADASCTALPPLPTVPSEARRVTDFGATANDNTPDDAAIESAIRALKPGDWLVFPPGRYLQSRRIVIDVPGVTVWGAGAEIRATNPDDQTVSLQADGVRLYGFKLTAVTDVRRHAYEHARISIFRDESKPGLQSGNVIRGNTITQGDTPDTANSASSAGILVFRARDFTVAENTVRRSLSDGIHITEGSRNGRVIGNVVRETGDDMIAVVSYLGEGWQSRLRNDPALRAAVEAGTPQASDVLIASNDVADQYWGRGISVIGSRNITVRNNQIANTTWAAGVIVAQEGSYHTPGPRNVLIEANRIMRVQMGVPPYIPAGPAFAAQRSRVQLGQKSGHGAIEVHAIQNAAADAADPRLAPALLVQDIRITGNEVSDTWVDGVRIGVSTIPALMQRITVSDNTFRKVEGSAISNLLGDNSKVSCSGNLRDGAATSGSCTAAGQPAVTGAKLNCALIP